MPARDRLQRSDISLIALLSTATFFEGYDFILLNLVLPYLQQDFGLSLKQTGYAASAIAAGTIAAFLVVRLGDSLGRRTMLLWTVVGYTIATGLTAATTSIESFVVMQFLARVFLVAEWGLSAVILAEELPASQRGFGIAIVQGAGGVGGIVGGVLFPMVAKAALGWRAMYLIGLVPLVLVFFIRTQMKETQRYAAAREAGPPPRWTEVLDPKHRKTLTVVALLWFFMYLGYTPILTFWTTFAMNDRGLSPRQVSTVIGIAYSVGLTGFAVAGKLMDVWGRRPTAVLFFGVGAVSTAAAFLGPPSIWAMGVSLVVLVFFATSYLALCATIGAELFPTRLRASAAAWTNNTVGRVGMVLAPTLVGVIAERLAQPGGWTGSGVGPAVAILGLAPLVCAALVLAFVPETRGRELEEIHRESGASPAPQLTAE